VLACFLSIFTSKVFAGGLPEKESELSDISWEVKERVDRVFYFTHGTAVWGHEFGFFKNIENYNNDILWLTFSSSDEKVKNFIGKPVVILLDIDGEIFEFEINMLNAETMGFTHVMFFTNMEVDKRLVYALSKGSSVKVQIVEPENLEVLLDIKEDVFDLTGFVKSRKQAGERCKALLPINKL